MSILKLSTLDNHWDVSKSIASVLVTLMNKPFNCIAIARYLEVLSLL